MIKIRYAFNKETGDHFPVTFRGDCERTMHGDESLFDLIEKLKKANYIIIESFEELQRHKKETAK